MYVIYTPIGSVYLDSFRFIHIFTNFFVFSLLLLKLAIWDHFPSL